MTPPPPSTFRHSFLPASLPYPAAVLLLFAITVLRSPGAFLYPSFWAEDGTFFFRQSVEKGAGAVLLPLYGSYHTIPRLVALAASVLPLAWTPVLFAGAAALLASACLALFCRPGFRWLVPDDRVRALLAVLFSLAPGARQSFLALCTVNYALFCGLLFLLLERDEAGRWRMGPGRAALVSFLWFSVGQGLVLAPLLLFLAWHSRRRTFLYCLGSLVLSVLLNLATENTYRPSHGPGAPTLALVFLDNLFLRLGFLPLLGKTGIRPLQAASTPAFLALSLVLLAGFLTVVRRSRVLDREGTVALGLAVGGAMAMFPLVVLARDYALVLLSRPHLRLWGRYVLVPSVLALLIAFVLARGARSRLARAAAVLALAWITTNVLLEPFWERPQPLLPFAWEWPRQAALLQEALRERRAGRLREPVVVGPILCRATTPDPWQIDEVRISP